MAQLMQNPFAPELTPGHSEHISFFGAGRPAAARPSKEGQHESGNT